jgi:transposase
VDSSGHQGSDQGRHQGELYRRIEVITGPVRRRRWTADEKAQILMESLAPGARISDVARRHNLNRGLLQTWRRQALRRTPSDRPAPAFVPVCCGDDVAPAHVALPTHAEPSALPGIIELESGSLRVRFSGPVDAAALRLVLGQLGRRA